MSRISGISDYEDGNPIEIRHRAWGIPWKFEALKKLEFHRNVAFFDFKNEDSERQTAPGWGHPFPDGSGFSAG